MNIDTARSLDYYAGVPLCFLGTVASKAAGLVTTKKPLGATRNVLFIELSEMGSVILASPAIRKLKLTLDVELHFTIFRKNRPVLDVLGLVPHENIFTIPDEGLLDIAKGGLKFIRWARSRNIDTVIDLELFSRFTALLSGISGAGRTVGFHAFYNEGLYRGDFLTHRVAYNPHMHISKNFMALVNALLSVKPESPYSKTVISDDEISIDKISVCDESISSINGKIAMEYKGFDQEKHRVVLFNTNASDLVPLRRWPQDNYVVLSRMLLDHYRDVIILLTGSSSEQPEVDRIASAVRNDRCISFAGRTEIADLPALYSVSELMLTNDSGPAHLASVTDMPVYVFFGPETPRLYGPLGGNAHPLYASFACSPCVSAMNQRKSACTDNLCLKFFTPEMVLDIIREGLDRRR